jgi:peptide/nickel transport system substrate-binding protein
MANDDQAERQPMISRRATLELAAAAGVALAVPRQGRAAGGAFRIGVSGLPPGRGNPFGSVGFPQIFAFLGVFDCLTEVASDGRIIPALAERWEIENERGWRFRLRPGLTFSNGESCDATAVAASLNLVSGETGRTFAVYRDAQTIARAEALDPLTVRIHTSSADPIIPGKLAGLRIVPAKYFHDLGAAGFAAKPVGTGPYIAQEWTESRVRLARNPTAWRKPIVDTVELRALPDNATRLQALLSGAVDVALNLSPDDRAALEAAGYRTIFTPRAAVLAIQFITERDSPLRDARVRRALNLAVDRARIVQVILGGSTVPASQASVAAAFGYLPGLDPLPFDPAQAKALLAEAGYPNGFRMPTTVTIGNSPNDTAVFQQVASDLAAVGVQMVVGSVPLSQFNRFLYEADWGDAIAFSMHYGSVPAMDATVSLRMHSCLWPKPWICDAATTEMIRKADMTFDIEQRRAVVQDIMRRLHDDPPGIMLHETRYLDALSPKVATYDAPFGFLRYQTLALS